MRAPQDIDIDAASGRERSTHCKPLFRLATQHLFRKNSFRVTGLPVDATTREISKHIDKLKQMTELGLPTGTHRTPLALAPPPTADDIRNAHQNLKDPETRIIEEFFWFWPEDFGHSQSDAALQALAAGDSDTALLIWRAKETNPSDGVVALHNNAVFWHLKALDAETDPGFNALAQGATNQVDKFWREAIKRWNCLLTDDLLWETVATRVMQIDEARLTMGFVRRIRASLPLAFRKVHAELALGYSQSGATDMAKMHIAFMRADDKNFGTAEHAAELVLSSTIIRVREHIRNAKQAAEDSPKTADQNAIDLIAIGLPLLATLDIFYGESAHPAKDILDVVATACVNCLVSHQRTTADNRTFLHLLERAQPLAQTAAVRKHFQTNIKIGRSNWAFENLKIIEESTKAPYEKLQIFRSQVAPAIEGIASIKGISTSFGPLSSATDAPPELFDRAALLLRNISIDAWNKYQDRPTAIEANTLALRYATTPELRQRLIYDLQGINKEPPPPLRKVGARENHSSQRGERSSPPPRSRGRMSDTIPWAEPVLAILKDRRGMVAVVIIASLTVLSISRSCSSVAPSTDLPGHALVADPTPPPAETHNAREQPAPRQPQSVPQNNLATTPQTYRISANQSAELEVDKHAIDAEKENATRLDFLLEKSGGELESKQAELQQLDVSLEVFGRQIDIEHTSLERRSQLEIDNFNAKVNRFNRSLQFRQAQGKAYNLMVERHNTLLEQVRTQNRIVNQMVDAYNTKLRQYGR